MVHGLYFANPCKIFIYYHILVWGPLIAEGTEQISLEMVKFLKHYEVENSRVGNLDLELFIVERL